MEGKGADSRLRLKQLFAATIALPLDERARFLDGACADAVDLRGEVESLLAASDEAGDFLERPASFPGLTLFGLSPPTPVDLLEPHRRLGPYEILEPLGAGGMGQVYRARDVRLDRVVALKVLPPKLGGDPARRERFVQEARAASALEHPHIAVIHEIGESDGVIYIAMELLRGETLSDVLARGPLPPVRAVELAVEIGEGLARAHDIGIVHRDLKPANVMLTEDGHAKIIDFGLAKLVESLSDGRDGVANETDPGIIIGTASYMSPEQARGEKVDHRSDVFSLGIVLYEMLAGRRPFRGKTRIDTLHAILNAPAPPLPSSIGLATDDVQRVIGKCLAKEPGDRYQGMRGLVVDLQAVRRRFDSSQILAAEAAASVRARRWAYGAVGLALLAVATAATFASRRSAQHAPADRTHWVRLTNLDSATQPALSSDGRLLAFIRGSGTFTATDGEIYLKVLPDGDPVQLTHDTLAKMGPAFSPDGARIAYTADSQGGGGPWDTWIVPTLRGESRHWPRNASGLPWAARNLVLFSEIKRGIHMGIVTSTESRANPRDVYVPTDEVGMAHRSYRSPDGRWVLVVEMDGAGRWMPCRLVPFAGGSVGRPLGDGKASCTGGAWSPDGKWVYFSANSGDGFHLWRQPLPDGLPQQLTSGPTEEEGVAVAPDGRSVITSVGLRQRSIWIHDSAEERQLSGEGYAYSPLLSADGQRVCYRVTRTVASGQSPSELWMADVASGRTERLLPRQTITSFDLSRDDRIVAAVPDADGRSRLWLARLDGREPPRRMADIEGDTPRFSAGGEIVFRAAEGNTYSLVRTGEDGTGRKRIATVSTFWFGTSPPDGQWLSVSTPQSLSIYSTTGQAPIQVFPGTMMASRMRWSADGLRLYLSFQTGETSSFAFGRTYVIPLSGGAPLPQMPAGGFRTEAELAAIQGVQILPHGDVAPGPTPEVYAFSRTTITRNLYRIPVP